MTKNVASRVRDYSKDVAQHLRRLLQREQGPGKALAGVIGETLKLGKSLLKPPTPKERKKSIQYVKQGIDCYNRKRLKEAERYFRKALDRDPGYARAHLYLGNALYKMGKAPAGIKAWVKAVRAEPGSRAAETARAKLEHLGYGENGVQYKIKEPRLVSQHADTPEERISGNT